MAAVDCEGTSASSGSGSSRPDLCCKCYTSFGLTDNEVDGIEIPWSVGDDVDAKGAMLTAASQCTGDGSAGACRDDCLFWQGVKQ
jgi:hypothetical protein